MKYLCLIYDDEKRLSARPESESAAVLAEYFAFTDDIQKSGHYIAAEALQPVQTATTVRIRNGKVSTTDGPFVETKEQLGGFYLLECEDLDQALEWAKRVPLRPGGSIEVRPVMDYTEFGFEGAEAREAAS